MIGQREKPLFFDVLGNIVGKAAGWPATGFETRVARCGAWGSRPLPTAKVHGAAWSGRFPVTEDTRRDRYPHAPL